jgi:hypothetical protein
VPLQSQKRPSSPHIPHAAHGRPSPLCPSLNRAEMDSAQRCGCGLGVACRLAASCMDAGCWLFRSLPRSRPDSLWPSAVAGGGLGFGERGIRFRTFCACPQTTSSTPRVKSIIPRTRTAHFAMRFGHQSIDKLTVFSPVSRSQASPARPSLLRRTHVAIAPPPVFPVFFLLPKDYSGPHTQNPSAHQSVGQLPQNPLTP